MTLRPEPYRHLEGEAVFRGLSALAEEARSRSVDISTLALAWMLQNPVVTAAIIGPRRPPHLDTAVAALKVGLSADDAERIAGFFSLPR
jgi:aryl-alcohol dehydrogenase-like predicted oxidoreductase